MNLLSQHIEYLLLRKECVILPGIGAFIATRKCAVIDPERNSILPPVREITFNSEVTTDDGMLAHSMARSSRCSFEEGRRMVWNALERLRESLDAAGKVSMGNVGTLIKSADGRLSFETRYSAERLCSLMGKPELELNPTSADERPTETFIPAEDTSRYYTIRLPRRMVHVAAAIVAITGICLSVLLPADRRSEVVSYASVVPIEKNVVTSVANESVSGTSRTIEEGSPLNPLLPEEVAEDSANGSAETRYYLVVGTFATEKGARRYVEGLENADLKICPSKTGIWRVSAMESADRNELRTKMNEPRFLERYPGSWIWERKGER